MVRVQEQLKDFLERKDRGELTVQKKTNFLKTVLRKVNTPAHTHTHTHTEPSLLLDRHVFLSMYDCFNVS